MWEATSLLGKELSDELQESLLGAAEVVLLDDDEEAAGQMTAAGDEPAFIQRIEAGSFDKMDFVFFAGDVAGTKKHWRQARKAGASIVDLTYAWKARRMCWCGRRWRGLVGGAGPDLKTPAVVAAHPAAAIAGPCDGAA